MTGRVGLSGREQPQPPTTHHLHQPHHHQQQQTLYPPAAEEDEENAGQRAVLRVLPPSIHTAPAADTSTTTANTTSPPPLLPPPQSALPIRHNQATAGLQIRTDLPPGLTTRKHPHHHPHHHQQGESAGSTKSSASPLLTPGLRHTASQASLSPSSLLPSPALAAMIDITPLPSPIMLTETSPAPWKRIRSGGYDHSQSRLGSSPPQSSSLASAVAETPVRKKKGYGSLMAAAVEAQASTVHNPDHTHAANNASHNRNRSISEFVPEVLQNVRPRNVTIGPSGVHPATTTPPVGDTPLHREHYLAQQRGLVQPQLLSSESTSSLPEIRHPLTHTTGPARASVDSAKVLPSPPPSSKSATESDVSDYDDQSQSLPGAESAEYFEVRSAHENRKRKWRAVRVLGQGTFSKVILATSQQLPPNQRYEESVLDPRKLVAVKIVEHGPAGGADEERIEVSLKREVDILKTVSHPSIVHLKALEYSDERALLVLSYCPGGDLFGLASDGRDILTPSMVQRMFAEIIGAVRYLHKNYIVHRDIKLENVLVTPTYASLSTLQNPQSHRYPLICLTDLGLSRRIPPPPASPLLTTRCGSEDYAAPEILLGQAYDGRSTDGWALGVLLYALMEGRLPFDCPPGRPERSKPSHRIARADWIWCRFGDDDGDWDETKKETKDWEGARPIVEALLKKVRMGRKSLSDIEEMEWVQRGIDVPGGLLAFDDTEPL